MGPTGARDGEAPRLASVEYDPTTGQTASRCVQPITADCSTTNSNGSSTTTNTSNNSSSSKSRPDSLPQSSGGFSTCSWFRNGGFKYLFVMAWSGMNFAVFWWSYMQYKMEDKYYYLRGILGVGLCFSRGSAAVLNLNCAIILLPMCRCVLSLIRRSKHIHRSTRKCLDRSRFIHIVIAVFICVGTTVHCVSHVFNAVNFSRNYNVNVPEVNVARFLGESPWRIVFTTVPGVTGCLMLLILFAIVLTSCRAVRASRHELFWYCHQFFFAFYALLICHSLGGILKEQLNTKMHTPGCIETAIPAAEPEPHGHDPASRDRGPGLNGTLVCGEAPAFASHRSDTWCFLVIPAALYVCERLLRFLRSRRAVTIIAVRFHPGDVMELQLHVDQFEARPGQYVMLQCANVSRFEWHPFTITRCPSKSNSTFTVHIRVCGDWTNCLRNILTQRCQPSGSAMECVRLPKLSIDGPFGSPSEDVFRYSTSICIAGGVGVTPFAAVLNSLLESDDQKAKLRRLYFLWICRHVKNIQWFTENIAQLHRKLWESNRPDLLTVRLYVTGEDKEDLEVRSSVDGLVASRLVTGRPNLKQVFAEVTQCNPGANVGVFVCGPKKLSGRVHRLCNGWSRRKTRFHYNKENFG